MNLPNYFLADLPPEASEPELLGLELAPSRLVVSRGSHSSRGAR